MYWQKLLNVWRLEGNDGLTIPFILGSQNHLCNEWVHFNTKDLIEDIIYTTSDQYYIKLCWDKARAVIIGVWDGKNNNFGEFLEYKGAAQETLFVTKFLVDDWKRDWNYGINDLAEHYDHKVSVGQYSSHEGKWRPFDESDMAFIDRCK